jgi:ADP-heptose:LPS heptosyltransferase
LLRNAHFAAEWGADVIDARPKLHPHDRSLQIGYARERYWRSEVARLRATALVGVVPAGTIPSKNYPSAKWAQVIAQLWKNHRVLVGFIGTDAEAPVIREIRALLGSTPTLPRDQGLDVHALAVILGRLDAVLSIDTGPAHLALAEQAPTVVLMGGDHPGRFFPWPAPSTGVVLRGTEESAVEPADVINACLDALGRRPRLRIAV